MNMNQPKIAIIGLGYVGLPLARLFATKYAVVGFDINTERVHELRAGKDTTLEVEDEVLKSVLVENYSDDLGLADARPSVEIAYAIRNSEIIPNSNLKHKFLL